MYKHMDVLAKQMFAGEQESGGSYRSPIDALLPESLGAQKRSRQYIFLNDNTSWSACAGTNLPASTSTIQISNRGIMDLKNSYIEFKFNADKCSLPQPLAIWECLHW